MTAKRHVGISQSNDILRLPQDELTPPLHTLNQNPKAKLSIGFVLVPEFTILPFSAVIDALRITADAGPGSRQRWCNWTIMSRDLEPVASSSGVAVVPWGVFQDPARFDYIAVVGGLLHRRAFNDAATFDYLRAADRVGVSLIGLCTGSLILARAGLMKGRRSCIHWLHRRRWALEFPDLEMSTDELFVVDRDRITCAGGTGAIDLALYLVERHLGPEGRLKAMQFMMVDCVRPADHHQSHFHGEIGDRRVRNAVMLMDQRMEDPLPLAKIAKLLGTSTGHLNRSFHRELGIGPADYARRLRLTHGRWLLQNTNLPITEVAYRCGFADASHFSRWCRKEFRATPTSLRAQGNAPSR